MADLASTGSTDALDETLARLSKKSGVKATIILDRKSGVILKTSGQVNERQGAEELAVLVWNFVSTAGSLVQGIDAEDELKLLRLRTKKQELVIVPDAKYLMILVHDTPPA